MLILCTQSNAAVSDNLNGILGLIKLLGADEPESVPEDFESATLVEKVNYLEKQNEKLAESIEGISQAANASYNLYVYIPKSAALSDYTGQRVTIASSSGNQSSYAMLRDDGTNYSTTLYFNFSGNCTLSYNALDPTGIEIGMNENVNITATGQERRLVFNVTAMSWVTIHNVLQAGRASEFGLTTPGTELPNGWYVISSGKENGKDTLFIWKNQNLGNMSWGDANNTATSYFNTFNSGYGISMAYNSRLRTYDEVVNGEWLRDNRTTGFNYWLETAHSSGDHYYVGGTGSVNCNGNDYYSIGCCPGVWIH